MIRSLVAIMFVFIQGLTAAQSFDPAQQGRTTVERLVKGDFAAIAAMFDGKMSAALPEPKLRAAWETVLAQAGALKQVGEPRVTSKGDYRIVVIPGEFERANADIQIVFDATGRIAGFTIRPAAPAAALGDPPYAARDRFTERGVTVDAGGWPLPGTLTIPVGAGPFPAVVLVHGSGPGDRDQSVGALKPFRDLAHGLASRGVAVVRYDKRTRQHPKRLAEIEKFTVTHEVVDDAVAAIALATSTAGIDPKRVFVAGLSLGGMLVPRIAAAAGDQLAGAIVMAGAVTPLEQALVKQMRYMALLDGAIAPDEQTQIDAAEQLVSRVRTLTDADPPVSVLGATVPASYFVDLRGYDPPAAARTLQKPMLVLQGERDYQVTMEDFARWKAALGSRQDVTLKSYPTLNHVFVAGSGQSTPAEYHTAAHVAEQVVRDIAAWVTTGRVD